MYASWQILAGQLFVMNKEEKLTAEHATMWLLKFCRDRIMIKPLTYGALGF